MNCSIPLVSFLALILAFSVCHAGPKKPISQPHDEGLADVERPGAEHSTDHLDSEGAPSDEFEHEAVLGSKSETEEYQRYTPEESKKRLAILAKRMDEDSNGVIEKAELEHWIVHSFVKLNQEKHGKQFDEEDVDKDGFMSWDDILLKHYGYSQADIQNLTIGSDPEEVKEIQKWLVEDHEKFLVADTNKDGKLDKNEYYAFCSPQHYPHMAVIETDRIMHKFDTNKNKLIDLKEFSTDEAEADKSVFENYDANKDGNLDHDEVKTWVLESIVSNAKSEAGYIFGKTDDDKDGKLSIEEILGHSDFWVGSQATDYGDHLEIMTEKKEL